MGVQLSWSSTRCWNEGSSISSPSLIPLLVFSFLRLRDRKIGDTTGIISRLPAPTYTPITLFSTTLFGVEVTLRIFRMLSSKNEMTDGPVPSPFDASVTMAIFRMVQW
ncbi:hypothetical protein PILCRDRAFT_526281 [Piloderma croceum F 1598]|uniref:Uncharacterized protein n=1 Tax=Piloderma croceum (strain F 1598) TaxID=765440 RepID=A0A0C3FLX6_PILCF|nr:hypothetical protein PILCRDRAFT_526281 [Piloderma croceum F 1598]